MHEPERAPARPAAPGDDDGFSMLEMLVALFVFALVSLSSLALILKSIDTGHDNEGRVVGANLAARAVEQTRAVSAMAIPDGTTSSTETVGGREYTITRTAQFSSTAAGGDCLGGIAYKRVAVEVTWPRMQVEPPRADTLRAVGIGEVDQTLGQVSVAVRDRDGAGTKGASVRLLPSGRGQNTGGRGCVVFASVAPGDHTLVLDTSGFVGVQGEQRLTQAATVTAGRSYGAEAMVYDKASSLKFRLDSGKKGYDAPATVGITVQNRALSPETRRLPSCDQLGTRTTGPAGPDGLPTGPEEPVPPSPGRNCVSTTADEVLSLFPFADGYGTWAGTCPQGDPVPAPEPVAVTPGTRSDVTLPVAPVEVRLDRAFTGRQGQRGGLAVYAKDACGTEHLLGTTKSDGRVRAALPKGTWDVRVVEGGTDLRLAFDADRTLDPAESGVRTFTVVEVPE